MRPTIELIHPSGKTEVIALSRERTVVGRSPQADIRINDKRVSREHCVLELKGSQIYVTDLGGSNGTWIGPTKLLSNVPEPFPQELVVHVGPAQLRNVTAQPDFDPQHDLESQAFIPAAPERRERRDGGSVDSPAPRLRDEPSAAVLEPLSRRLAVVPGERVSLPLTVTNQSKIVDHYTLSVAGVPSTWVTLPTAGLELLPRESGALNMDVHPPRSPRTSAGIHPMSIALLNQQRQIVVEITVELEIAPFENLEVDVRPNPYQSRSGGALTLTVENQGNAQTDYRVDVIEPSDSLEIAVDPPTGSVAPQQSQDNLIRLRPRKRVWVGEAKRLILTVTVTGNQQSVSTSPTYTQLATFPRWLPMLLLMCCCILIPIFAFMIWQGGARDVVLATDTPTVTPTPENTATATPDTPLTLTATRIIWEGLDDDGDGLTNGDEINVHKTQTDQKDSDTDGLSDFDEVTKFGTSPLNIDTDGDTLSDGMEAALDECRSPIDDDTDGDGVADHVDPEPCSGITPTPSPVPDFALGGHVNNSTENLGVMDDARMSWVKVQVRYSPGGDARSTRQDAAQYREKGFKVLLSVVGHKEDLVQGGGGYVQAFATFLGELAPEADGIEVWNEPNIQREWPVGEIDPGDYTDMLRAAFNAIKAGNPRTLVISAAPAPTGTNNETVMSDDNFIRGMMAAGAGQYMDCVGAHFNAGATPASARSGHPTGDSHYSWYFLPTLELYYGTFNPGDGSQAIPVCFTEIGYLTPDGFDLTLAQAGATDFWWAEGTSEREQAEWLEEALLLSCRSGKVLLFIVWNVDFTNYEGGDPQAGYAIIRPDESCPSCETLRRAVGVLRSEGCMK